MSEQKESPSTPTPSTPQSEHQEPERVFKGVWIPAEVWDNDGLSWKAKLLWAIISSLGSPERPCWAGNQYLAEKMGLSPDRVRGILAELRRDGWVVDIAFDGRKREILAVVPIQEQPVRAVKNNRGGDQKQPVRAVKNNRSTDRDRKGDTETDSAAGVAHPQPHTSQEADAPPRSPEPGSAPPSDPPPPPKARKRASGAKGRANKGERPPAYPPGELRRLTDGWIGAWEEVFGEPYVFAKKDAIAAHKLLNQGLKTDDILRTAKAAWLRPEEWCGKMCTSLACLASNWNGIRRDVAKEAGAKVPEKEWSL